MSSKEIFNESIKSAVDGIAIPNTPFVGIICFKGPDGRIRAHSIGRLQAASIREVAELHITMIEAAEASVLNAANSVDRESGMCFLADVAEIRTEIRAGARTILADQLS